MTDRVDEILDVVESYQGKTNTVVLDIRRILDEYRAEVVGEVAAFVKSGGGGWAGRDVRYELSQAIIDNFKQPNGAK